VEKNDMAWIPHQGAQTEFCSRGEFEVLFGGAAGPGKTDCLIMEATRDVRYPSYSGLLLRRTFPQLQEIIDRCHMHYPYLGGIYKATEHRWYFPSGATINLGHMQHENDKYNYQGKEFQFVGFDELTQFTETQYLYLFSRARSANSQIKSRIRATTNPGGIGHIWVKERFIDRAIWGETYIDPETGLSRVFIPARATDNPSLFENDPEYINRLKLLTPIERMRLLDGIWDAFENQAFPELSQRLHGSVPFPIPPEWEKFTVMDWGFSKPFSIGWYAVDFDGVLYRYREWYGCRESHVNTGLRITPIEVARGIIEREKERVKFRVADPACWSAIPKKDGSVGPSIIEDMTKEGIYWIKADNTRILGKLQCHQRFRMEEIVNNEGVVEQEYPRFVAFNDQTHFWRTMPQLRLDAKNDEDVDCFVAGTLISTPLGNIPIENIHEGDIVETPIGPRKVIKAGLAGKEFTTKITFSDNSEIESTQDHKIFIKGIGLLPVYHISSAHYPMSREETECLIKKLSTEVSNSRNVTAEDILNAIPTMLKSLAQHYSIGQYGLTNMYLLLLDTMSTIGTMIPRTTALKLWNLFMRAVTQDNVTKKELMPVTISEELIKIGEEAGGERLFFAETLRNAVEILPSENLRALIVVSLLELSTHHKNIALQSVEKETPGMKNNVLSVEQSSGPRSIIQKKSELAVTSVVGSSEKKEVYYLTIDQAHLFYANNILVANTEQEDHIYDEFRYACMARPIIPKKIEHVPQGTFASERSRYIKAKKYAEKHGVSLSAAYARVR
jgi:hypothetical protein